MENIPEEPPERRAAYNLNLFLWCDAVIDVLGNDPIVHELFDELGKNPEKIDEYRRRNVNDIRRFNGFYRGYSWAISRGITAVNGTTGDNVQQRFIDPFMREFYVRKYEAPDTPERR